MYGGLGDGAAWTFVLVGRQAGRWLAGCVLCDGQVREGVDQTDEVLGGLVGEGWGEQWTRDQRGGPEA